MKKFKLLPAVLMLVLCVGVLAIGVFAITPTKNTISGTITINASNPEMIISVYGLNAEGQRVTTVCENVSVRSGMNIDLGDEMEFDLSEVNTEEDLKNHTIDYEIKVENPTTTKMAVYFTTQDKGENVTKADIKTTAPLTTTGENANANTVKANFSGYTVLPAKGANNGECLASLSFEMIAFASADTTVNLAATGNEIYFNIAEYKDEFDSNEVMLANSTTATVTASVTGAKTENQTSTLTAGTAWEPTLDVDNTTYTFADYKGYAYEYLYYDEETEDDVWREYYVDYTSNPVYVLDPMIITYTINNPVGNNPVRVNIQASCGDSNYTIHTVNNSYIPAGESGTASVQVMYNIPNNTYITELPEAPKGFKCNVTVTEWTDAELADVTDVQERIVYDQTGIADGTLHYYIEYGTNPYYTEGNTDGHREKLRWYIWAKEGTDGKEALGETDPRTTSGTYYFISEYTLDGPVSGGSWTGIPFQNGYESLLDDGAVNNQGNNANYYAESNVRNFLNGETVRNFRGRDSAENKDTEYLYYYYFSAGTGVNFYERFGLTEDPLYNEIQAVTMSDLYSNIYYNSEGNYGSTDEYGYTPEGAGSYAAEADKFWCLSYSEANSLFANNTARVAKQLSSPTSSGFWWLRSPSVDYSGEVYCVLLAGQCSVSTDANTSSDAVRPSFKIVIN